MRGGAVVHGAQQQQQPIKARSLSRHNIVHSGGGANQFKRGWSLSLPSITVTRASLLPSGTVRNVGLYKKWHYTKEREREMLALPIYIHRLAQRRAMFL